MSLERAKPPLPDEDKRWKLVNATMRRNGYADHALIETLHSVQDAFGFLDETSLHFVAASLDLPLSKVYGVATLLSSLYAQAQGASQLRGLHRHGPLHQGRQWPGG